MKKEFCTAAVGWGSRLLTAASQLLAVRFVIERVGTEGFAVFALVIGVSGWFQLADFGFGSGLQNYLAENRGDIRAWRRFVTVAWLVFLLASIVVTLVLVFASRGLGPLYLGQFSSLQTTEKANVFFIGAALSTLTVTGGMGYRILFAEGRSTLANLLPALGAFFGLLLIWVVPPLASGGVLLLIAAFMGPGTLIAILTLCWVVRRYWGGWGVVDSELIKLAAHRARSFWLFMLLGLMVIQVDYIVISQLLDATGIALYNIGTRVFGLLLFLYTALLAAVWPECTIAFKNRWGGAIRSMTTRLLLLGGTLVVVGSGLIYWSLPLILEVLAPGKMLKIPGTFILLLALYALLRIWSDTFAMLLQSASEMTPFWKLVPLQALISLSLQLWLGGEYGLHGVMIGVIASFVLTVAWGLPLAVARMRSN